MRLDSIVLLAATPLLACIDGAPTTIGPEMTTAYFPARVRSFTDNDIPTKRLLRASYTTDEDDEDSLTR